MSFTATYCCSTKFGDTPLPGATLKANLELNELMDSQTISQLHVHYQSLSAFVHPLSEQASQLPYARNSTEPIFDHYSEELILLYVCFIALEELHTFFAMTQRL